MQKPAILIIDDEVEITKTLTRTLRDQFTVFVANNSKDALETLAQNDIAVILTDQRMAETNGVALLEKAQKIRPDVLGVIITGYSDISVLIDAINLGTARGYIPKPWNLDELRNTLNRVVRQYQAVITDRQLLASTAENISSARNEIQQLRTILDRLAEGQLDAIFQSQQELNRFDLKNGKLSFSFDGKYFDSLSDGLAVVNHLGVIEYANSSFLELLNLDDWQGKFSEPLIESPAICKNSRFINTMLVVLKGEYILADVTLKTTEGELRYIELTATPIKEEENQYKAVLVARDQTLKQEALYHLTCLNAVAKATSQTASLKDSLPIALDAVCDALFTDGYIILLVDRTTNLLYPSNQSGISPIGLEDLEKPPISIKDIFINDLKAKKHVQADWQTIADSSTFLAWAKKEGIVSFIIAPIQATENLSGFVVLFTRSLRKFSENDQTVISSMANQIGLGIINANLHEKIVAQAQTDELTGIMNRRYFMEVFNLEYDRCLALKTPLTLLMLDMDNFKTINDLFGHQVGDKVLRMVSEKLNHITRSHDYVARYGGDEFIILLTDCDIETGRVIARRIENDIAAIKIPAEETSSITLGISIGVAAMIHNPPESLDNLISRADFDLYKVKANKQDRLIEKTTVKHQERP